MTAIDEKEAKQRAAILKRLRKLLVQQRDKFRSYLNVLEHQQTDIIEGDTEKLQAHVKFEESIVKEIYAFQKVIDPLEDMYHMAFPRKDEALDVPDIKESLDLIKTEVLERNKKNQELLSRSMTAVRGRIKGLQRLKKLHGISKPESTPSFIDTTV